jgi:hypothetical protein
VSVRAVDPFGV